MATSWKSQMGDGNYALQFETDDVEKYKLVEKSAQMAVDGKTTADIVEVKHGKWIEKEEIYGDVYYTCSNCNNDWTTIDGTPQENFMAYCPNCGAKMDGEDIDVSTK